MIRKVLAVLFIYISAMCIVSAFKFVFSDTPPSSESQSVRVTYDAISENSVSEDECENAITSDKDKDDNISKSPFSFTVNITETEDTSQQTLSHNTFSPILMTEPPNILGTLLAELEMRKQFIVRICMRRFRKRQFIPT